MRSITLIRTSPNLYRLALAWPLVRREACGPAQGAESDPWAQIKFSFPELSALAAVSPSETLAGFDRLKAAGIIRPDGSLDENVGKLFKADALAAFGVKVKPPKGKPQAPPEDV